MICKCKNPCVDLKSCFKDDRSCAISGGVAKAELGLYCRIGGSFTMPNSVVDEGNVLRSSESGYWRCERDWGERLILLASLIMTTFLF